MADSNDKMDEIQRHFPTLKVFKWERKYSLIK